MEVKAPETQAAPQAQAPVVAAPAPNANAGLSQLEKINLVRQREGLEPLSAIPNSHKTEAEIKAEIQAQKEQDDANAKAQKEQADLQAKLEKEEADRLAAAQEDEQRRTELAQLDDDKVLAYLQSKDPTIKSIDDIARRQKTAEEIEKEKDVREADMLAYGLKSGKFTKAKYEKYAQESKDPAQMVFVRQFEEAKADDPGLTEEDFRSEFNEKYGIGYEETSRRFKQGQKDLSIIAQTIMRNEYGEIISLNQEYSSYEEQQNRDRSIQMKVMANRPAFEKEVRDTILGFANYQIGTGEEAISVPVTPAVLEEVKSALLADDYVKNSIVAGWSKEAIKQVVDGYIISRDRESLMRKYAEAYNLEKQKGSRGIPPARIGQEQTDPVVMDERLKKAAERHGHLVPNDVKK